MRQKKKKEILGTDTEISLDYFVKASSRTWKAQDQWEGGEIGKWVENNRRIRDRYILIDHRPKATMIRFRLPLKISSNASFFFHG